MQTNIAMRDVWDLAQYLDLQMVAYQIRVIVQLTLEICVSLLMDHTALILIPITLIVEHAGTFALRRYAQMEFVDSYMSIVGTTP
jgi:hypothetical protein